jgi:pimeloyl-ACP methyl ester carboxylesterase
MARLDGTAKAIDLEPGYTLTAPGLVGNTEIQAGRAPHTRAGGLESATSAFDTALENANLNEIRTISLDVQQQPAPAADRAMRTIEGEDGLVLEVPDLGETVGQVVLAIDNGVVTWNFPQDQQGRLETSTSRGAGATKRFVIRNQVSAADDGTGEQNRGLFGAIGKKILKVLVYNVTDAVLGPIGKHFARKWEEKNRPYNIRRFTLTDYQQPLAQPLSDAEWQLLTTGRSLLFVHGTFSTAHGGFGSLPEATLRELHDAYQGRVFAFDHLTLSASPEDNVNWFSQAVRDNLSVSGELDLDVICHSRGGLVSRILAGELSTGGLERIKVSKVVFVATPNQGTLLADPDHMVNFLDRYTSALDLAPPGPAAMVSDLLEAILAVVKIIGRAGLTGLDGLSSMDPGGSFIAQLNSGTPVATEYFGMSSNYEPSGNLRGFTMMKLGDKLVDRVFQTAPNDLVVPTDGVNQGSPTAGFPIPDERSMRFSADQAIWHSDFFGHPDTSAMLREWLLPP